MNNNRKLAEGIDFYYDPDGLLVLTERYHLERGTCCGNGCRHCPYDYSGVTDASRRNALKKNREDGKDRPVRRKD